MAGYQIVTRVSTEVEVKNGRDTVARLEFGKNAPRITPSFLASVINENKGNRAFVTHSYVRQSLGSSTVTTKTDEYTMENRKAIKTFDGKRR